MVPQDVVQVRGDRLGWQGGPQRPLNVAAVASVDLADVDRGLGRGHWLLVLVVVGFLVLFEVFVAIGPAVLPVVDGDDKILARHVGG